MSSYAIAQPQNVSAPQEKTVETVSFQRQQTNQAEPTVLHERLFDEACGTFAEPRFGYDFSRVPAHTDMIRQAQPLLRTGTMVQRYSLNGNADSATCATCSEESSSVSATAEPTAEPASPAPEATPTPTSTEPEEKPAAPEETTVPALLVEDSATELAPGQMRKSEFIAQLRTAVTSTAESAMAGTGRTTADCPYLDYWFSYYSAQDVQHGERALRRYAPEASSATTAREYIPIIAARVRRSVDTWVRTGEIEGVPEGMLMGLSGMSLLGSLGRLVSGIGSIFFKARNGGARKPNDPRAIRSQLGSGQPLNSGVRSRMESAFGMDFSHVRTHTDTNAAGLSDRLNARAFTVGKHVAFGSGEYRPGTLFGDALIAHEMAHVVQQSGAGDSVAPMQTGDTGYNTLENDADRSAASVVSSLWFGAQGALTRIAENVMPRLRSGLGLQRCDSSKFPSYDDIVTDGEVRRVTDDAWASTEEAADSLGKREEGFWIMLNTGTRKYEFTGHWVTKKVDYGWGSTGKLSYKPRDLSAPAGTIYTVGFFHTHTPNFLSKRYRIVGPQSEDDIFHYNNDVVGVVYDYVESPRGSKKIPALHPKGSPARRYHSGPDRRQNE